MEFEAGLIAPISAPFSPGKSPIPGGWTIRDVSVAGKTYRLSLPARPDDFLDDPAVQERNRIDDWMPYWAWLWPAAEKTAELVTKRRWQKGLSALELGCGIGLVGLSALEQGLDVVFSDAEPKAVALALHNAQQNGHSRGRGLVFDWHSAISETFPIVLGCDLVYDVRVHHYLLQRLTEILSDGGTAWLGDPGRGSAAYFIEEARRWDFHVELYDADDNPLALPQDGEFQLIVLSPASGRTAISGEIAVCSGNLGD